MIVTQKKQILQHKSLRQFVKFCLIGFTSMIVNMAVSDTCYYRIWPKQVVLSVIAGFVISVCNGFFWNRRWTFKESRKHAAHTQYIKFFAINVVGLILNTTIVVLIIAHTAIFSSSHLAIQMIRTIVLGQGKTLYPPKLLNGAQLGATVIVVFWNFFANRKWTFSVKPTKSVRENKVDSNNGRPPAPTLKV